MHNSRLLQLCSDWSIIWSVYPFWFLYCFVTEDLHCISIHRHTGRKQEIIVIVGKETSYWVLKLTFQIKIILEFESIHTYNCQWLFICIYLEQEVIIWANIFKGKLLIPLVLNSGKDTRNKLLKNVWPVLQRNQTNKIAITCLAQLSVIFEEPKNQKPAIFVCAVVPSNSAPQSLLRF